MVDFFLGFFFGFSTYIFKIIVLRITRNKQNKNTLKLLHYLRHIQNDIFKQRGQFRRRRLHEFVLLHVLLHLRYVLLWLELIQAYP